eukprot:s191_g10.t1
MRDSRVALLEVSDAQWIGQPEVCSDFLRAGQIPPHAFLDLAFVDDCALAMHAPTIPQVLYLVEHAVHSMDSAARKRGLLLNYAPGKTEVLLHLVGRGSTAHKAQLHDAGSMLKWTLEGISYQLRVSHCYKHLGTWLQKGAKSTKEVQHRGTVARQSWGPLYRSFYSKRYVSLKTKVQAFRTLTMSRLLKWQNAIRKPLGLLVRGHTFGVSPLRLDVPTLCGLLRLLPPADALHVARLKYVKRLLACCPEALWMLLLDARGAEGSWISACETSFAWFRQFYSDHLAVPAVNDIHAWVQLIALDSNWKGRLRSATRACCAFRQAQAEALTWQKQFEDAFCAGGAVLPQKPAVCEERWTCEQCDKWFASKRALATHSARAHGYRRLVQYFAVVDVCQSCCRWYHNRSRLTAHLSEAHGCLQVLQACFPPVSDDVLAEMDQMEYDANQLLRRDGWGATKALQPMRQLFGPRLPPADSLAARDMQNKYIARQGVGGAAFALLQGRCDRPVREEPEVVIFAADFPAFVLQMDRGLQVGSGVFDYGGLAKEYALLHVRSLLFVHFFSGYRRRGDLHSHLDHRILAPGLELHVISVDLCLQRQHGNLADSSAQAFWHKQIDAGRVLGAGGGPP